MTQVEIYPTLGAGDAGYLYDVTYLGKTLLERTRNPAYDSARALQSLGATGQLSVVDGVTGVKRMTVDIEKGAKLVASDHKQRGLSVRKWKPYEGPTRDA
jgi:hypothetical protein